MFNIGDKVRALPHAPYSITTNGGVILYNGNPLKEWSDIVKEKLKECNSLENTMDLFNKKYGDLQGILKVRSVDNMFFYLVVDLEKFDLEKLDPFRNIRARRPQLQIGKNGKWKFPNRSMKYFDYPHRLTYQITCGEYQKIKLQTFNPGSRSQVVDRIIKDYGWIPTNYTEKGSVKLEFE